MFRKHNSKLQTPHLTKLVVVVVAVAVAVAVVVVVVHTYIRRFTFYFVACLEAENAESLS